MKGSEAIAKTAKKLEIEFNERKSQRIDGITRHIEEIETKISKLEAERQSLLSKKQEIERSSFRKDFLSEEARRQQSEASKKRT